MFWADGHEYFMFHAPCTRNYVFNPVRCEVCDPILDTLLTSDHGSKVWLLWERVMGAHKLACKHKKTVVWARPELMDGLDAIFAQPVSQSREVALPVPQQKAVMLEVMQVYVHDTPVQGTSESRPSLEYLMLLEIKELLSATSARLVDLEAKDTVAGLSKHQA